MYVPPYAHIFLRFNVAVYLGIKAIKGLNISKDVFIFKDNILYLFNDFSVTTNVLFLDLDHAQRAALTNLNEYE